MSIASENASSHLLSWVLDWISVPSPPPGLRFLPSRAFAPARAQARLFCLCGETRLLASGLCASCYRRHAHSRRSFAGHREAVLDRDRHRCCGCGSERKLVVHHRRPGIHQLGLLITLCAACHARLHRLRAIRYWVEPALVPLWHEQHPRTPLQLQLVWDPPR